MAELLLPRDFGLAFRALHAFGEAAPARAYAGAARRLAASGAAGELRELLGNVSGTVSDDEWDQARFAALTLALTAIDPRGAASACSTLSDDRWNQARCPGSTLGVSVACA